MNLKQKFAVNLKTSRTRANLTQEDLASLADLSVRQVQFFESADHLPKTDTLLRLCDVLGTTPNDLLPGP